MFKKLSRVLHFNRKLLMAFELVKQLVKSGKMRILSLYFGLQQKLENKKTSRLKTRLMWFRMKVFVEEENLEF